MIIVANRLPVRRVGTGRKASWASSAGGLVTAVRPVLERFEGVWVGWTGIPNFAPGDFEHDGMKIRTVQMSESEVETFYEGFSNNTLWPLFHDAIREPEFHRKWWHPYRELNQRFAHAAADLAKPGDIIWVQDYHLCLVPQMIRELRPDARIGYFLHIPFPPEELFAWLPWRESITRGMLGADLIGFHTADMARNFSRAARRYADVEGTGSNLTVEGRHVRIGAFPISIDYQQFARSAENLDALRRADEIREQIGRDRKIMLAVDRLDYTKGIDYRLRAFEELLSTGKASVDDVSLIQIAAPSRDAIADYQDMRDKIELMVGRINGRFSKTGAVAVHYFWRNVPRDELVSYYLASDVMLVTPLRDGMNLVAKEYVATKRDLSGVLVLSEFAGASHQMRKALPVNPRDIDQMTRTFQQAIAMDPEEARKRMSTLRSGVRRDDVYRWANNFLGTLLES